MLSLLSGKVNLNESNIGMYVHTHSITGMIITLNIFLLCLIYTAFIPCAALADIYKYKDKNGVMHFTNIRSDIRYTLYIKEARENPDAFITKYDVIIEAASEKFSMEPSLVKAVIKAESGFDHTAVSSKGAQGLMQLMPGTAEDMEVDDPYNPEKNIFGGTKYLSKMMERYKNDVRLALAAYNAGPEKVDKYKDVPPFNETKAFIERVMKYYDQYLAAK
ncbi:MAG: lytic transglycosylase domain-containing protein [Desulfatiglans sp.]|jgi:soluble lytic murein transglycosylase|nr:lytic transglycosylase domain-containing protein [Desulfatiglans sp.]